MTIPAKYESGVFRPSQDVTIAEGTVVEVHVPEGTSPKPASIRVFGFVGMWADREDIPNGLTYVAAFATTRGTIRDGTPR